MPSPHPEPSSRQDGEDFDLHRDPVQALSSLLTKHYPSHMLTEVSKQMPLPIRGQILSPRPAREKSILNYFLPNSLRSPTESLLLREDTIKFAVYGRLLKHNRRVNIPVALLWNVASLRTQSERSLEASGCCPARWASRMLVVEKLCLPSKNSVPLAPQWWFK